MSQGKQDAQKILENANQIRNESKEAGYQDGSKILLSGIPKILESISKNAFSSKITAEVNNDFIKKLLQENYESK